MAALKQSREDFVSSTREHIQKVFPHTKAINIKVVKDEDGEFESVIEVDTFQKRKLIAIKKGVTYKDSLNKSYRAIIKQISRVKTKWDRRHNKRMERLATIN